jgi:hypothetical protein
MSKLGFDKALRQIARAEREFFQKGMKAAQKDFKKNFANETDSESGTRWHPVLRNQPPPILDVKGKLKKEALDPANIKIYTGKAVLTVDPIDTDRKRPDGYAKFQQDGFRHASGTDVPARPFITQSAALTTEQEKILLDVTDKIFK